MPFKLMFCVDLFPKTTNFFFFFFKPISQKTKLTSNGFFQVL